MNNKLERTLKSHFSHREDVPLATHEALRLKLHAAANARPREKLTWTWFFAPCAILISILLLIAVSSLFGLGAALLLWIGYYLAATVSGGIIITILLSTKQTHFRKVNFT